MMNPPQILVRTPGGSSDGPSRQDSLGLRAHGLCDLGHIGIRAAREAEQVQLAQMHWEHYHVWPHSSPGCKTPDAFSWLNGSKELAVHAINGAHPP